MSNMITPNSTPHLLTNLLIIEDNLQTQAWLLSLVSRVFPQTEITCAASLKQGLQLAQKLNPQLAIIDLGLPDGSGIEIIHFLKKRNPECLCIVATIFDDDDHLFNALKAGANGYILKDQSASEIEVLLAGIINDSPPLSPSIARRLMGFFQAGVSKNNMNDNIHVNPLTQKETEVLLLIAKGYTVAKTAELSGISYHTAAGYVKTIYRKLNISSRAEAANEAMKLGVVKN